MDSECLWEFHRQKHIGMERSFSRYRRDDVSTGESQIHTRQFKSTSSIHVKGSCPDASLSSTVDGHKNTDPTFRPNIDVAAFGPNLEPDDADVAQPQESAWIDVTGETLFPGDSETERLAVDPSPARRDNPAFS